MDELIKFLGFTHVADSREVTPGSVFYALKGATFDGHDYLQEVKNRGALAAVIDEKWQGKEVDLPLIRVPNVLEALQKLAKIYRRKNLHKKVIGVTGSCGKTTTKEFIAKMLSVAFSVEKSPGSLNSQVTMPLCVLNLLGKGDILVLEMGMSRKGEMAKLTDIAVPNIVILTPITYAHSEFFADIEGIASAKGEIFTSEALEYAFIHRESMIYQNIQRNVFCPYELFGGNDFPEFSYPFTASHLIEDAGAAIRIGKHLGMNNEAIQRGLKELKTYEHRFDEKHYQGIKIIDDSYNANPKSMTSALLNMPLPSNGGRRIGVFGSMGELGSYEEEGHKLVGQKAVDILDELLCIGAPCRHMVDIFQEKCKKVSFFSDYSEMKKVLKESMQEGDVVLVKGSKFHKLWTMIDYID